MFRHTAYIYSQLAKMYMILEKANLDTNVYVVNYFNDQDAVWDAVTLFNGHVDVSDFEVVEFLQHLKSEFPDVYPRIREGMTI